MVQAAKRRNMDDKTPFPEYVSQYRQKLLEEKQEEKFARPAPILTSVFRAFGWLGILAAIVGVVFCFNDPFLRQGVFVWAVMGAVPAIVCFGIAEIIHKIAKIEFSASQNHAILDSLQKIEFHLVRIRGGDEVNVVIKKVKSEKENKEEY